MNSRWEFAFNRSKKVSGEEYGVRKDKRSGGLNCPNYIAEMLPELRLFDCLFVCLFDSLRSHVLPENFSLKWGVTISDEGFKFWPILGIYDHWVVRVLQRATPSYFDTGHTYIWSSQKTCNIHTYFRALGTGAVTICFYNLFVATGNQTTNSGVDL